MPVWWKEYENEYLGKDHEYKEFEAWIKSDSSADARRNNESETDLMNSFRDTEWWTGSFLDWAHEQATKDGVI